MRCTLAVCWIPQVLFYSLITKGDLECPFDGTHVDETIYCISKARVDVDVFLVNLDHFESS